MNSKLSPTPNRELSREEVDTVLDHLPLIVLADDDPSVLTIVTEILTYSRENSDTVIRLQGDMEQCFNAVRTIKPGELPIVLCRDGVQAKTATRIIAERKIDGGVMLFDDRMGLPRGSDIFKGINGNLPQGMAKILMSATPPDDVEECLKKGVLDLSLTKPMRIERTRAAIARTYLKKAFIEQE